MKAIRYKLIRETYKNENVLIYKFQRDNFNTGGDLYKIKQIREEIYFDIIYNNLSIILQQQIIN